VDILPGESWPSCGGLDLLERQAGRCAAYKAVFDPNLKQGGNTNLLPRHTVSRISVLTLRDHGERAARCQRERAAAWLVRAGVHYTSSQI
jgi:hypothetical protein